MPGPTTVPDGAGTVTTIPELADFDNPEFRAEVATLTEQIHASLIAVLRNPTSEQLVERALGLSMSNARQAVNFAKSSVERDERSEAHPETRWYAVPESIFTDGEYIFVSLCMFDRDSFVRLSDGAAAGTTNQVVALIYTLGFEGGAWKLSAISNDHEGAPMCEF